MAATARKYLTVQQFEERLERRLEQYLSRAELKAEMEPIKDELRRLAIRTEVLGNDLHSLTVSVGGIAEDVAGLKDDVAELRADVTEVKADVAEVKAGLGELARSVQAGQASLMAAVLELGRR